MFTACGLIFPLLFVVTFLLWLRSTLGGNCRKPWHDVCIILLLVLPAVAFADGTDVDLQATINAASAGSQIKLQGVYTLAKPVYVRKPLTITGPAELREQTRLASLLDVATAAASGSTIQDLRLTGTENASTFLGGPAAMYCGIRIAGIDNVRVDRVTVTGKTYGFWFDTATRCRLDACTVDGFLSQPTLNGNYHSGCRIDGGKAVQVRGISVQNIGSAVLLGKETQFPVVDGVYAENLQDNGVYLSSGTQGIVRNVVVNGAMGSGVKVRGSLHSVAGCSVRNALIGVTVTGNGTTPDAEGCNGFGSLVTGCTVADCQYGVLVGKQDGLFPHDVRGKNNTFLNVTTKVRIDGGLRIQIEE